MIALDSPPSSKALASNNPPPPGEESLSSQIPNWWLKPQQMREEKTAVHKPEMSVLMHEPVLLSKAKDSPLVPSLNEQTPPPKPEIASASLPPQLQISLELPPMRQRTATPPVSTAAEPTQPEQPTPQEREEEKVNMVHFDPELHWCRVCNTFPRTAKEFLNHLHAPEHKKQLSVSFKYLHF